MKADARHRSVSACVADQEVRRKLCACVGSHRCMYGRLQGERALNVIRERVGFLRRAHFRYRGAYTRLSTGGDDKSRLAAARP